MSSDEPQPAEEPTRRRRRRRRGSHTSDAQHPWVPLAKIFAILAGGGLLFLTGRSLWRYTMYVKQVRQQTQEQRALEREQGVDVSKIKLERIPSTESQMALEALRNGAAIPAGATGTPAQPTATPPPSIPGGVPAPPATQPPKPMPPAHQEASGPTGPLAKAMPPAMLPLDADSPEAREAIATLRACESAMQWRDLLPMVRDPERCEPLMRLYYQGWKATNPPPAPNLIATRSKLGAADVVLLFRTGARSGMGPAAAGFTISPAGKWVLDWESWVGCSELPWEDFRARRTITPSVFRVIAASGSYYNYEFTDSKRYLSVKVTSPDGKHGIHAFCERDSPLGQAMVLLVTGKAAVGSPGADDIISQGGDQHAAVTLRLAFPPAAQSDNCVVITDLVSGSWLVDESDK